MSRNEDLGRGPLPIRTGRGGAAVNLGSRARGLWTAGVVVSLAALSSLSLSATTADAAFPGLNGKIACGGPLATELSDPLPAGQSRLEIFDINPDATGERRLTQDQASDASPRYSADGKKIVFNKNSQIWTMNADGSNQQGPLTSNFEGDRTNVSNTAGHWSPDGTQIVFQTTRHEGFSFDIYKMNADGTNQTRLTADPTEDSLPAWSPDGSKIVFNSRRGGSPDLWVMNADGSNPAQITNFPGEEAAAQWSPDGRQLVFHSDLDFQRPGLPRNLEIYRMNADGSGTPTRLTFSDFSANGVAANDFTGFDLFPAWSPEGDQIVFHSGRAPEFRGTGFGATNFGQWEAYRVDAVRGEGPTGSPAFRLTTRPGNDERCNWQPVPRPAARPPVVAPPLPVGLAAFPECPASSRNVIRATTAGTRITGTVRGDRIFGGTGNDVVDALAGDDCVDLGTGDDRGQGGIGNDLMSAGLGDDTLSGSSGNDRMRGNPGSDRLNGGRGDDRLFGDSGNDSLLGSFGNDRLHGVSGKDRISGSRGRDRINGGSSNDRISGGSSGDRIAGDAGHDRINGNSGADRIKGNSGNDRITSRDSSRDRVNCGNGRDSVLADRRDIVARNCERVRRR